LIEKVNTNKIIIGKKHDIDPEMFFNVNSKNDLKKLVSLPYAVEVKEIPNLMVIAGTGRNVGKTTCDLRIGCFARLYETWIIHSGQRQRAALIQKRIEQPCL